MPRRTNYQIMLDRESRRAEGNALNSVPVNVMDLGKVGKEIDDVAAALPIGTSVDTVRTMVENAARTAVEKYRKNS